MFKHNLCSSSTLMNMSLVGKKVRKKYKEINIEQPTQYDVYYV